MKNIKEEIRELNDAARPLIEYLIKKGLTKKACIIIKDNKVEVLNSVFYTSFIE